MHEPGANFVPEIFVDHLWRTARESEDEITNAWSHDGLIEAAIELACRAVGEPSTLEPVFNHLHRILVVRFAIELRLLAFLFRLIARKLEHCGMRDAS